MATGVVVALVTVFFWEAIPHEALARRVLNWVFYPEGIVLERVTDWLSPGNRDQGIRYWLIIHPVYCILLGGLIGFGAAWTWRRFHRRGVA
jgi:hypothetical protein